MNRSGKKDLTTEESIKTLLQSCLCYALREAAYRTDLTLTGKLKKPQDAISDRENIRLRENAIAWLGTDLAQEILLVSGLPATCKLVDLIPTIESGEFKFPRLSSPRP